MQAWELGLDLLAKLGSIVGDGKLHDVAAFRLVHQILDRVNTDNAALDDEGDASAKPLGLFDVMGSQEDRRPPGVQVGDELANLACAGHIDPGGRLIHEQNRRRVDDSRRDSKLALHALGVSGEFALRCLSQAEAVEQFPRTGSTVVFVHAIKRSTEAKVLKAR